MAESDKNNSWLIIGITGVTCGGKTTLANKIKDTFQNCEVLNQDNYFYLDDSPHHIKVPNMNHNNYDILSSLDMEKMHDDMLEIISSENQTNRINYHNNVLNILVVEGFCVLNYKPIANLCKLKYAIYLSKDECVKRRNTRVYDPPDIPGYFEACVWPEYLKHTKDLEKQDDIILIHGKDEFCERVLGDIENLLNL